MKIFLMSKIICFIFISFFLSLTTASHSFDSLDDFYKAIEFDKDYVDGIYNDYFQNYKTDRPEKAIAISRNKNTKTINWSNYTWGVSFEAVSRDEARELAISECETDKYDNEECVIIIENEKVVLEDNFISNLRNEFYDNRKISDNASSQDNEILPDNNTKINIDSASYSKLDFYKLKDCYYSESFITTKAASELWNQEIGTSRILRTEFDSDRYDERSIIVDLKNNTLAKKIVYSDKAHQENLSNDEYSCEQYGLCEPSKKIKEENFFISSYFYPTVKMIPHPPITENFEINLEEAYYFTDGTSGKTKYQCVHEISPEITRKKKIYPYEKLSVKALGAWSYNYELEEETGDVFKIPKEGLIAVSLEPFPLKERKKYILQISNEHNFITANPEDLFIVKLTDSEGKVFGYGRPSTKEFVAIISDDKITGVSRLDKFTRNNIYDYASLSDNEKRVADWKIRHLDLEKIFIEINTGYLTYGEYDLHEYLFNKDWYQIYLTDKNKTPGFLFDTEMIAYIGSQIEDGGEAYIEPISFPDTSENNQTPIYGDNDPDENVAVASGSGFFINEEGNIITNNHVIDGCNEMKVLIDGKEHNADVIAFDQTNDIALLKTDYKNKSFFNISKDDVQRAENIKAIGYGFGKNYSSDIKITGGIVSSLSGFNDNYSEFQMDAAIQSGNSGGPVLNDNGDVVGISVSALDSIAVYEDTGTLPQNVNYAIKASTLKQFLLAKETHFEENSPGWFSFSNNVSEINEKIDNAAVYLSCYMTYAQIEENITTKTMFESFD